MIRNCVVENNKEEWVFVTEDAKCTVSYSVLLENKAPGIDCSGNARCLISDSQITSNVGGIWACDDSSVTLVKSVIDGGTSHALVFDVRSSPTFSDAVVLGVVHASANAWKCIRGGRNVTVTETQHPSQWPSEDGVFKFQPDSYNRKMWRILYMINFRTALMYFWSTLQGTPNL